MEPTHRQPPHPLAPEASDAAASGAPGTGAGGNDRLAPPPGAGMDLEAIAARAARGGFFWLVSVLERLVPAAPRVGGFGPAADESLRFRHDPLLVFNTSDVSDVKVDGYFEEPRFRIQTTIKFDYISDFIVPLSLILALILTFILNILAEYTFHTTI